MSAPSLPPLPPPHTRIGVGGVLFRDGRVLVNRAVYRTRFTIPSGYVEAGEALESALAREFEEETGIRVAVGPLVLARHKVVTVHESDLYLAFVLEDLGGTPEARPPEIAEFRLPTLPEAAEAPWISELSRLAIRLAARQTGQWPRSAWAGGEAPGLASETFHATEGSDPPAQGGG